MTRRGRRQCNCGPSSTVDIQDTGGDTGSNCGFAAARRMLVKPLCALLDRLTADVEIVIAEALHLYSFYI